MHIDDVRGGSALLSRMPSSTTSLAGGLGFIGPGPPFVRPIPQLS